MRSRSSSSPTTTRPTHGSSSNGEAPAVATLGNLLVGVEAQAPVAARDTPAPADVGGPRRAAGDLEDPFDGGRGRRLALAQPPADGTAGQGGRGGSQRLCVGGI